jgi:hypothetical protein
MKINFLLATTAGNNKDMRSKLTLASKRRPHLDDRGTNLASLSSLGHEQASQSSGPQHLLYD